jgi:hypothetical protein
VNVSNIKFHDSPSGCGALFRADGKAGRNQRSFLAVVLQKGLKTARSWKEGLKAHRIAAINIEVKGFS